MISGRGANARGRKAENDLAAWLRDNGWPDAQRAAAAQHDRGDIAGLPGVAVEIKHCGDPMRALRDAQREAVEEAHGRLPVAVVRLPGVTDPADWWAATPVRWVDGAGTGRLGDPTPRPGYDLLIDARPVSDRCNAHTIHRAIHEHGGALRGGWWISNCDRLFATIPNPNKETKA